MTHTDAQDLIQTVWMEAVEKLDPQAFPDGRYKRYLQTLLRWRCINFVTAQKAEQEVIEFVPSDILAHLGALAPVYSEDKYKLPDLLFSFVTGKKKQAIILMYRDQLTKKQIAKKMNISLNAVKKLLYYGRQQMRDKLTVLDKFIFKGDFYEKTDF